MHASLSSISNRCVWLVMLLAVSKIHSILCMFGIRAMKNKGPIIKDNEKTVSTTEREAGIYSFFLGIEIKLFI